MKRLQGALSLKLDEEWARLSTKKPRCRKPTAETPRPPGMPIELPSEAEAAAHIESFARFATTFAVAWGKGVDATDVAADEAEAAAPGDGRPRHPEAPRPEVSGDEAEAAAPESDPPRGRLQRHPEATRPEASDDEDLLDDAPPEPEPYNAWCAAQPASPPDAEPYEAWYAEHPPGPPSYESWCAEQPVAEAVSWTKRPGECVRDVCARVRN